MGFTYVSLFSGVGGFDVGFQEHGFQNLGAFDVSQIALENHQANLLSPVYSADLAGPMPWGDLPRPDLVVAGPPCQGFSTSGKRIVEDPRNHLLLAAVHHSIAISPQLILIENVRGVLSGGHKRYWETAHHLLRNHGYKTSTLICSPNDLGHPQERKRAILIAWQGAPCIKLFLLTGKTSTLGCAIRDVDCLPNHEPKWLEDDSIDSSIAKTILPGQKLCDVRSSFRAVPSWSLPELFGIVSTEEVALLEFLRTERRRNRTRNFGDADPVPLDTIRNTFVSADEMIETLIGKGYLRRLNSHVDLARTYNGKFRRLDPHRISPTVDTRFGSPKHFLHPVQNRGLSVREAARIQGFKDSFIFTGSRIQQYVLVGNAVSPVVSRALATLSLGILETSRI